MGQNMKARAKVKSLMSLEPTPQNLRKTVFLLAWPVMAQMSLQTLVQIIDMAMVGRLGKESIAAVGLSFRPLFVGQAIFLGLGVATTAMVARFIGAKDKEMANKAAQQAMMTTSILALALAAFGLFFARQINAFMGAEGEVITLGTSYLQFFSPGMFFLMLATIMTAALRGSGDTKSPLYAGMVTNVVNVTGNYILIFGKFGFPALGVVGAAIATSFSHVVSVSILLMVLLKGNGGLSINFKGFTTLDMSLVRRLFRIGLPAAGERLVQSLSMMLHIRLIAGLGTTAVAVATLTGNVEQIAFMPSIGFGVAAAALVGQNLGAQRPKQAERSGWTAMQLSALFMGTMGVLFFFFPRLFIGIFTSEVSVVALAIPVLWVTALTQVPMAVSNVSSGALRGAGDTKSVLYISIIGNVVLRLGLTYVFLSILGWPLWTAYVAVLVDWLVRGVLLVGRFKTGGWKKLEV